MLPLPLPRTFTKVGWQFGALIVRFWGNMHGFLRRHHAKITRYDRSVAGGRRLRAAMCATSEEAAFYPHGLVSLTPTHRMADTVKRLSGVRVHPLEASRFIRPQSIFFQLDGAPPEEPRIHVPTTPLCYLCLSHFCLFA